LASTQKLYQKVLGERDPGLYDGKFYPSYDFDVYSGEFRKIDDESNLRFEYKDISYESFFLNRFFEEFQLSSGCPNHKLGEHSEYIRYSYRLITLSYLAELLYHYHENYNKFNQLVNCEVDFTKLINKCRPETEEMKYFQKNSQVFLSSFEYLHQPDLSIPKKLAQLEQSQTMFAKLYKLRCQKKNCSNFVSEAKKMCDEAKVHFLKICSEKDQLYGQSFSNQAYDLLSRSNITNNFNVDGEALGCLRRYSQTMKYKERKDLFMTQLYPVVREDIANKYGRRFLQGMMFIPGALKEFRTKGLKEVFQEAIEEEEALEPVIITKPKVAKKKVKLVKKKIKKVQKKKNIIVKEKRDEKKLSAFYEAVESLEKNDLDSVEVDMLRFKYDYIFSLETIEKLNLKTQRFTSQKGLKEMRKYDKLGSEKAPVPLRFVKFLIDTNKHKELYNMIIVLGDKFHIKNNIDEDVEQSAMVYLKNDSSTNYQWNLVILNQ
jgi:hypothetical protein